MKVYLSLVLAFMLMACSHVEKKESKPVVLDPVTVTPEPEPTPPVVAEPVKETLPDVQAPPEKIPEPPKVTEPNPNHIGEPAKYEEPLKPLPSATGEFTTNLQMKNCTDAYVKKGQEAAKYIKAIFNSEEFKDEMINFTYLKKKQFVDNGKMTNEQIYEHLMKGAEALRPTINWQMDLTIECYYKKLTSTIGYTVPSANQIWVNTKYHASYTSCQIASNDSHEWTHKMGFGHAQKWSSSRDYSVPYGMNTVIEKLCPLAKANKLTPLKGVAK